MSLLRALVLILAFLALLVVLFLFLHLGDLTLSLWQRLQEAPLWFSLGFLFLFTLLLAAGVLALWRLSNLGASPPPPPARAAPPAPVTEEEVTQRISRNEKAGADVYHAQEELAELRVRRQGGHLHVALLAQINAGKSSLINALLPNAQAQCSPIGGTTRAITRYQWHAPGGDQVTLSDLPGLDEVGKPLEDTAREEALRAHVVLFLTTGDMTRDQFALLSSLTALKKPLILAFNKMDHFRPEEQKTIRQRLEQRIKQLDGGPVELAMLSAGGQREVIRRTANGEERVEIRPIPPQIDELATALNRVIDRDPALLDHLRDMTIFHLAAQKLDAALARRLQQEGERIVSYHAKKAVIGAMAAVAPGMDLVVQGILGVSMVKELSQLHQVPIRELDLKRLLETTDQRLVRSVPLLLAILGNALKAFPGVGTVAGGLMHAVAYGLIFDSLGKAVAQTLAERGELAPRPILNRFEEFLSDDLQARARRFARLAMEGRDFTGGPPDPSPP